MAEAHRLQQRRSRLLADLLPRHQPLAIGVIGNVDVEPGDAIATDVIRGFSGSESVNLRHNGNLYATLKPGKRMWVD